MEKLYYDVLDNKVLKEKPKRLYEKIYLIDEDTFDNRFACAKNYLKNKIEGLIKYLKENNVHHISFEIELGYYRGYNTTMSYKLMTHSRESKNYIPAIITSGRVRLLLQEIIKEIMDQNDNCWFYEKSFDPGYRASYYIMLLDNLESTTWEPFNNGGFNSINKGGNLIFQFPNERVRLIFYRKDLLSAGKEFFTKIKLDIGAYVLAMKKTVTDIKTALAAEEKKVEGLKKKLADAEAEYAELEDYEKLLGEIYEGEE